MPFGSLFLIVLKMDLKTIDFSAFHAHNVRMFSFSLVYTIQLKADTHNAI